MKKNQLFVVGVLALVSAVCSADPTWTPTKHDVVGTWQTGTNWFGDVAPSAAGFQSAIVGNEATINVNSSVEIYELAIGTPWDDGGYNSPTSKQGGTLNIGAGGYVWTKTSDPAYPGYTGPGNFYVAHVGNGNLNVTDGGSIQANEFSVSKYSGIGLAVFDGGNGNVGGVDIGANGTVILQNNAWLKVWESWRFSVAGVFDIADTTSYLSFYGSVDPGVYANVTALGGAGQLVAVSDGAFTNIYAVVPEPATLAILGLGSLGLLRRKR